MKRAALAGMLVFAGILACPKPAPPVPTYKTSMQELQPYFASYLWIDENAVHENTITRVNICQGTNGLEHLTEQGFERDAMKEATAFSLLTGALPELGPIIIEYAQHTSYANCPPNDVDCLRDAFHNIIGDARFEDAICTAEDAHNTYARQLLEEDVLATEPNATLLEKIRQARMAEEYDQPGPKPEGVFYLEVCE